ncbi:MAG: hypothetical protein AB7S44_01280 [Spirochaetales bacterium]
MKRTVLNIILVLVIASVSSIFYGCSTTETTVFASSANYSTSTLSARVGDVISLQDNPLNIEPASLNVVPIFSSSNSNIASINALNGTIECLQEGEVTITGRVKSGETTFVGDSFRLIVSEELIYATGFSLNSESTLTVALTGNEVYNELTLNGTNVNVLPSVSYSSSGIATYNYTTGLITPISVGEVTVFVSVALDGDTNITKEFTVQVVEQLIYIDAINTYSINTGQTQYISYVVRDNSVEGGVAINQVVVPQIISGGSLVSIVEYDYGYVYIRAGNTTGQAMLRLTYSQNENIILNILININ